MINLLLILLGATMITTGCNQTDTFTQFGYYRPGEYNIYLCNNANYNRDAVIYHELGHLYWYMYMNKQYNSEEFANIFSNCFMDSKCGDYALGLIIKTL